MILEKKADFEKVCKYGIEKFSSLNNTYLP